jgi:hypothetical protein
MAYLSPKTKYGIWAARILVKCGDAEWVEQPKRNRTGPDTKIVGAGLYGFSDFVGAGVDRLFAWAETKGYGPNRKE